ncbi:MAG: hypothetical protein KGJ10_02830 [Acidobacteriota bacterium]|nr:hypothetical protein [Acidobacteriota bacterium]MDE3043747.1 hypothetical protein [Acidobacteriota bacterium]MDE3222163.1 hypothetical protein [Acidobacteriota bacterium]
MIQRVVVVLVAGVVLAGCGSIKLSTAMVGWVHDNAFVASSKALSVDASHVAGALRAASSSVNELHTVCGVLLLDTQKANTPLPTPDDQATKLLSGAYENLAGAANECYGADASPLKRARALAMLARGLAKLSEGVARVAVASAP